ncbi:hemophore-related protein [Gordonia rhizosphera]|uniref:Haemophore haem-binding domain-containing protein n=1 Tax=Gordonia rhizosphera NBRC 16068 TaxID=1108045 RepID=K6X474_9ACTN|nr:hemophore-related protein [Gordonia rhizosphera]GAB93609.1 hypothetical protein GORHZ_233_00200 [Gordonia rhizosphera NBRC 16068]
MNHTRLPGKKLLRGAAYTVAGAGIASAIAVGGVATAAPSAPPEHPAPHSTYVPGTHCSLAQVERALAKQDPALWMRIDTHPRAKHHFETTIMLTPQQRQARRAQFRHTHPNMAAIAKFARDHHLRWTRSNKDHDAVKRAEMTCARF